MSAGTLPSQSRIQTVLQRCRRQILIHNLISAMALLCTVVLCCIVLAAAMDFLIGLPSGIRAFLLGAGILVTLWVLVRHVVAAWRISIPVTELGAAVDLSAPELQESLTTLLSLQGPNVTTGEAGSDLMREHLRQQVTGTLDQIPLDSFVETRRTVKRCVIALLIVLIALLPALVWPTGTQLLLARLFQPFGNFDTATNLFFEVDNGDRTVARGSDVRILAKPRWRTDRPGARPESVHIELTSAEGQTEQLPMAYDETSESFVAELPNIQQSVGYRITSGRSESQSYRLSVVDAPQIIAAVMTASPPVYTGRPVARFDGMVGEMKVFERSQVRIDLEFSKPVTSAALVWLRREERPLTDTEAFDIQFDHVTGEIVEVDPEDIDPDAPLTTPVEELPSRIPLQLMPDGTGARLDWVADLGGDFRFEVRDEFELLNPTEPERYLHVEYDMPPELSVSGLRDGDALRPTDILPVNCHATDDIGIGRLELHYRVNNGVMKILPAEGLERGSLQVQHAFRLGLDDLDVRHADTVTIRVRTTDERPEPRPHEVWSPELTIRIDDDAAAAGAQALSDATQQMIDQLKKLEAELHHDANQAGQLKQQAEKEWTDEQREQTQGLSEKEQQQGRQLEQIAAEVATHPLMQDSAQELNEISSRLQQEIPARLDEAVDRDRRQAARQLDEVRNDLREAAQQIARQIGQIEKQAQLEQNLTELNRLALEAEQLAQQAEQLEQDRRSGEAPPAELSEQDRQADLNRRQQHLNQQQQQLRQDIGQLLQREQELLQSAQKSQQDQLASLADQTRQLAARQKRLADAVQQEAREAGTEANGVVRQLEQAKREAADVNRKVREAAPDAATPPLEPLNKAVEDVRRGNLAAPIDDLAALADEFETTATQLQSADSADSADSTTSNSDADNSDQAAKPTDDARDTAAAANTAKARQQRQQAADDAAKLSKRLADISRELQDMRSQRAAATADRAELSPARPSPPASNEPSSNEPSSNAEAGGEPDSPNADSQASEEALQMPVSDLLQRVDELAAAAGEMSNDLKQQPDMDRNVGRQARSAADQTERASQEAQAGQFSKSAEMLRKASGAAANAAQGIPQQQADRKQQLQNLGEELGRLAGQFNSLQRDNPAQAAAQQQTQEQITRQTQQLPQQLGDLAERLGLPELQLPQPAVQAGEAQQAAAAAGESSQQANDQLQEADLQQAAEAGRQAAEALSRTANLAQQAAQDSQQQSTTVPTDVGERVADALQQLQQAAQSMPQPSPDGEPQASGQQSEQSANGQNGQQPGESQPGDGQPGDGQQTPPGAPGQEGPPSPGQNAQPGQGSSGSQQLNDAAQALADAAENALPSQFNPGRMNEGSSGAQGGNAMGNTAAWNGQLPGQSAGPAGSRDWGNLNEELQTETADQLGISRDSEYESLIRMYFREVAKAVSEP